LVPVEGQNGGGSHFGYRGDNDALDRDGAYRKDPCHVISNLAI